MNISDLLDNPKYRDLFDSGILINAFCQAHPDLTDISESEKQDIVRAIQQGLRNNGYLINVDGVAGTQTCRAWTQFKIDNHQLQPELIGIGSLGVLIAKARQKKIDDRFNLEVNPSKGIFYALTPMRRIFLALIRWSEGTDISLNADASGYDILYGGKRLSDLNKDYSDHPKIRITAGGYTSSAAGAYQIMDFTWKEIQRALHLPSFEPVYQDQACLWLIHIKRHLLNAVDQGNLDQFLRGASLEWASFPYSPYGQPTRSLKDCHQAFRALKKAFNVS